MCISLFLSAISLQKINNAEQQQQQQQRQRLVKIYLNKLMEWIWHQIYYFSTVYIKYKYKMQINGYNANTFKLLKIA